MNKGCFNGKKFLCSAEHIAKDFDVPHPIPHLHEHYELYFLHSGNRDVFIGNQMFSLSENCLAIIPPHVFHKTEGGAYSRTNLAFTLDFLEQDEIAALNELAKQHAVFIGDHNLSLINQLLKKADEVNSLNKTSNKQCSLLYQIVKLILLLLAAQKNQPVPPASSAKKMPNRKNTSSEMLRIAQFINENYMHKITLDDICKKFLISKTALNLKFKDVMQCTVVDYILNVRFKRAIYLLNHTRLSIETISQQCGFSSANYFSLIFKKKLGISPSNYHRRRRKLDSKKSENVTKN